MNAQALLAAIIADPDDDLARLAYADWLEEQGDTDRGTFIRVQVSEAQIDDSLQLVPDHVDCHPLQKQAHDLMSRHEEEWMATVPRSLRNKGAVFRRGFVEELRLSVERLLKVSGRFWSRHPINRLVLNDLEGKIDRFFAMPQLSRIRCLSLLSHLHGQDLTALATTDRLSRVSDLTVIHGGDDPLVEALAACPSLRGLTRHFVSESRIGPDSLARFTASGNADNLTDLRVDALRFDATERAQVLANSPSLASLERLTIGWSGDQGVAALADSPHLGGLRWLSLRHNCLTPAGVETLAATRRLTRLWILELSNNEFGAAGVRALSGATWEDLARLDLLDCELGDEGVVALAECRSLANLRSLSLDHNEITAEGVKALAYSPVLHNLEYLSLYDNKVGDEGAATLCESLALGKLTRLGLGYSGPFSPPVQEALRQRFGDGLRL